MKVFTVFFFVVFTAVIPLQADTLLDKAINAQKAKEYDKAIKYAEQYLETSELDEVSQNYALFTIGYCYEKKRNPSQAIDYYLRSNKVYKHGDLNANAHVRIGLVYNNFNLYQEAIEHFNHALSLNTREAFEGNILIWRAIAYKYISKYDSALSDVLKAERIALKDLENRKRLLFNSYAQRGLIKRKMEDYDEAIRFFELANDLQIGRNTLINIGGTYHARGENTKAIEVYKTALASKQHIEQRFKTFQKLGEIHAEIQLNDVAQTFLKEAEAIYSQVLYPDSEDIDVYHSLAQASKLIGQSTQYSQFLERGYSIQKERNEMIEAML